MLHAKSLKLTKQTLQQLLNKLMDNKCSLYWRYDSDVIYLKIDTNKTMNELAFTKEGNNALLLDKSSLEKVNDKKVKSIVKSFLMDKGLLDDEEIAEEIVDKTKKHLQLEIDYYLMELYDYIQSKNTEMINKTKDKLTYLTNDLKEFK